MLDSTKTQHSATSRFLHIISTLYIEFFILLICTLVISQTGKSTGPVFDVVGPDLIPLTVAYVVAALTLLQLVVESRKMDFAGRQMNGDIGFRPIPCLLFCCLSGLYVLSLANAWAPFYLATFVFITLATLTITAGASKRDVVIGMLIGLGVGALLQFVFTQILVIDLPV
ncbi:MAG: tripartite tricarboxylate transporter TctB family protein [Oceanospirillaceae bacterium]|nr:tripartite tricarboxylate transporter TctB family protein [Oceanospirillaceae bacterium]